MTVGLLRSLPPERFWLGASLAGLDAAAARRQQLKMQMIFQDPYASLNRACACWTSLERRPSPTT
jgi:peptide/nickel transport system ATP-binding protein